MQCRSCSTQLAEGAAYCPTCGAVTPYNVAASGISPYAPTVASSPSGAPLQAPPLATDYGSPPHGAPPQNPYGPLNPYAVPLRSPPPPLPRRHVKIGLIIGAVVLVVALASAGVFASFTQLAKNGQAVAATENPYTHSGKLNFSDPLTDNSQGHKWAQDPINCGFTDGAYHVKAPLPHYNDFCLGNATYYSDFAFEVQMTIIKGDEGGIIFRQQPNLYTTGGYYHYAFRISPGGGYDLTAKLGRTQVLLVSGRSEAIKQGLNQTNLIAVVAQGNTIIIYVNHQQVGRIPDNTFSNGQIGFIASAPLDPTEVVFSNAKVWTL